MDVVKSNQNSVQDFAESNASSEKVFRTKRERFSEQAINQNEWISNTTQTTYSTNTLIGNWYEDAFDIKNLAKSKCIPSQYDHYFETTYSKDISKGCAPVPKALAQYREPEQGAYPAHQPILDTSRAKSEYNSCVSTYTAAFSPTHTGETMETQTKQEEPTQ